jgi:D-cysteine desulfhydrase
MKEPDKIKLANLPTPVQNINFKGYNFLIKRDDLTGIELSGNKVRKLEYLLFQARKEKADYVFTTGGEQSNHVRATVIAAASLGLKSKVFLWGKDSSLPGGNLFLDKFFGAKISFLDKREFQNVNQIMLEERKKYLKRGKNVYAIPEGGSTTLGIWGYVNFVNELKQQINFSKLKGICCASGSGGTAAGLLVGLAIAKMNFKIYAVNVLYEKDFIRKKILNLANGCLLDYNIHSEINEDNLVVVDGYSKEGYKNISSEKVKLIKDFAKSTGILLDPAYTGKAFYAYYENFLQNNFGNKIIFLHTGGIYGAFSKIKEYLK